MKQIPLHSLIIIIQNLESKSNILNLFPEYEILSFDRIQQSLTGDNSRHEFASQIFKEIAHQTHTKLSLGERVVINIPELRRKDRLFLANIGNHYGSAVFYIIIDSPKIESKIEKQVFQGDGVAEVIDSTDKISVVSKLPTSNLFSEIKARGFRGITAVGDVHAMRNALQSAISWGIARGHFIIFLGDIIDYGPKPIECIEDVYNIVTSGRGALIYGNHERKIEKWLDQERKGDIKIRLSDGNQVTIDALKKLSILQFDIFRNKYKALMSQARHSFQVSNIIFTHAAFANEMIDSNETRYKDRTISSLAMFGQVEVNPSTNNVTRLYNWVDTIPKNYAVFVGHDIRSTEKPFICEGQQEGQAIFLDTGSGKGGILSTADIRFKRGEPLKIENFNRH
jgi:hypothetical protein